MAHQHLVLAYAVTWGIQLTYTGYLAWKWRAVRETEHQESSSFPQSSPEQ